MAQRRAPTDKCGSSGRSTRVWPLPWMNVRSKFSPGWTTPTQSPMAATLHTARRVEPEFAAELLVAPPAGELCPGHPPDALQHCPHRC